jgi:phage-related protein
MEGKSRTYRLSILCVAFALGVLGVTATSLSAKAGLLTRGAKGTDKGVETAVGGTSKGVKEAVGGTGKGIKETVGGTGKGVKGAAGGTFKGVKSAVGGTAKGAKETILFPGKVLKKIF